jgi:hypothetical protein
VIDLVEEYFKRDLNATEEAQLAKLLAASPEAALKMSEGMAGLYRQGGQAEPSWPERPLPTGWWKGAGPWIKLSLFALLNLGLIALGVHLLVALLQTRTEVPAAAVTVEYAPLSEVKPRHKTTRGALSPKALPAPTGNSASAPLPSAPSNPLPAPQTAPALPIIGRQFEQLSVVVDNPQEGLATVKVFDSGHNLVRRLFTGILPAGKQTFTWDGRTDQGGTAASGTYSLEVQTGDKVIRNEVHIKAETLP